MRTIPFEQVVAAVEKLCLDAAFRLPDEVLCALKKAQNDESSTLGKSILGCCLENADIAEKEQLPLCQDTGTAVFMIRCGSEVHIDGGNLTDAVNEGVRRTYRNGYLRKSIVDDPLYDRLNTKDNTPAAIHAEWTDGDKLDIAFAPKGGGAENMSAIKMLTPADGEAGVIQFVVDTVRRAGGNPCPPIIAGIGIGGNFEGCALLAKKALFRPTGSVNPDRRYADLERRILTEINQLGIGPQGLGGDVTALAVQIETAPTHIASLPVAVNINCHSARHAHIIL